MHLRRVALFTGLIAMAAVNSVSAADLAVKAPVYKAPVDSWTGFYVGIIGGYATGPSHSDPTGVLPLIGAYPVNLTAKGGFAGGQLGYDYQLTNRVVLGVVGDMAWANLNGSACAEVTAGGCTGNPRDSYAIGTVNWLATIRGKAGFAVSPQALLYATGGAAFAGTKARDTFINGTQDITSSATNSGWAIGAGVDYKFTRQISFGLEYIYADFGKHTYVYNSSNLAGPLNGLLLSTDTTLKLNILKASMSYHF